MSSSYKQTRISRDEARKFAEWLFLNNDFELLSTLSAPQIQRYYKIDTGKLVQHKFINDQFKKWTVIDGNVYKISEPWTHPQTDYPQK